ncbi:MAG: sugar phosphate isomerase/epimerase [Planctomycetes bacterium]|nr:sugar phosphate isomerase/epimerase [Planctomycetota bacterium]
MYLTGFADEAAKDLDGQIKATKALGWSNIESRNISGTNIHEISDGEFETVCGKLSDAGISVNCFGSAIANWACEITTDFDVTIDQVKRAIPRMQKLGTKLIRIMSYAPLKDNAGDDQAEEERFRRLRTIKMIFDDAGITAVHENCRNYGGLSFQHTLKMLDHVPGLRLVFDTGNPVFLDDHSKPKPYPKQSSWEFYSNVKDHISYIHIKDCVWNAEKQCADYTYPGDGDGDVKEILTDLIDAGFNGGMSIEPHLAAVFHDASVTASTDQMMTTYIEYGKRLEALIKEIKG